MRLRFFAPKRENKAAGPPMPARVFVVLQIGVMGWAKRALHVSPSQRGKMECHGKPQRRFAGRQANETKMFSASLLRSESS